VSLKEGTLGKANLTSRHSFSLGSHGPSKITLNKSEVVQDQKFPEDGSIRQVWIQRELKIGKGKKCNFSLYGSFKTGSCH
jgi:hypothetical protein